MDRFWAKVNKAGPPPPYNPSLGPCWLWTASLVDGYGKIRIEGTTWLAHRYAYFLKFGSVPVELDHLCRVRTCINPAHLEPVTRLENILRSPIAQAALNARKTHCANGHAYSPETTSVLKLKNGHPTRVCRLCRQRRYVPRVRARKTHCPAGHEYTPKNTYLQKKPSGRTSQVCRECDRLSHQRAWNLRKAG